MPQFSLYIDEATLRKVELAAAIEHLSISKFVVKKLNEVLHASWPEGYDKLFGSVSDESFRAPDSLEYGDDVSRESL